MPPTNANDSSWSLCWREELTRPCRYQISDREVLSDQDRLQGVLRGTRRLDNVVQGRQLSAHECADALTETAGDETKQTATISIAAAPTHTKCNKPGFYWSLHARKSRSVSWMRKSQPARHEPSSCSTNRPVDSRSADVSPLIST